MTHAKASIYIDGEFYIRCATEHVDSVIDGLEVDGLEVEDITWVETIDRFNVRVTTSQTEESDEDRAERWNDEDMASNGVGRSMP